MSEKVGTIFENTKIPLRKWFMAAKAIIYRHITWEEVIKED